MPRDHAYDYAFRPRRRGVRRGRAISRFKGERRDPDGRMGLHDLAEGFGRYSGGEPYGYEYSERSIEHRHAGSGGSIGFTRPLGRGGRRRLRRRGQRVRQRGADTLPRRPWEEYDPQRTREMLNAPRADAPWEAYPPRRGRDRYWTFRGTRYRG